MRGSGNGRGFTALLVAVSLVGSLACQAAPQDKSRYDLNIDRDSVHGHLTVRPTLGGTRVTLPLIGLPPGMYEAYFSSDACLTRSGRMARVGLMTTEDVTFTVEDPDLRFSSASAGGHHLGIETLPGAERPISTCISLAR